MASGIRPSRLLCLALGLTLGACGSGPSDSSAPASPPPRTVVAPGKAPSAWSQASGDAARTSATPAIGPQTATVRWTRHFGGAVAPGPAVGIDGSILVAANDGIMRALDPATGRTRWSVDGGGGGYGNDLSTTPAVLSDGTILWPGPGNRLIALDRGGRTLWSEQFEGFVLSPAAVGGGRVYVADQAGSVRALDVDGAKHSIAWALDIDGTSYSSPAVGPDGTVYAAADSTVVAIADHGDSASIRWRFQTRDIIEVSTAVAPDGTVVVGTNSDVQYGLRPDGSVRWTYPKDDWTYSSPVIRDGRVYFGDHNGWLNVLDVADGRLIVRHRGLGRTPEVDGVGPWTAPLVDAAGNVYFGTAAGHVYGFAADGRRLFDLPTGAVVAGYPALTADGTLIVGDLDGVVRAVHG